MALETFAPFATTVVSKDPLYTSRQFQCPAVQEPVPYKMTRWGRDLLKGRLQVLVNQGTFLKTLSEHDLFVLGGGGLLVDISDSVLDLYLDQVRWAKTMGCKVMTFSIGAGPIRKAYNQKKVAKTLNQCVDFISVRDEKTKDLLESCGVNKDIHVFPDPVEAMICNDQPLPLPRKVAVNIYRLPGAKGERLEKAYLEFLHDLLEQKYEVVLLPFGVEAEIDYNRALLERFSGPARPVLKDLGQDFRGIVRELATCEFALVMRFHASLLSLVLSVPAVCVDAQFKAQRLLEQAGLSELLLVVPDGYQQHGEHDITSQALQEKFQHLVANRGALRERFKNYIERRREEFAQAKQKIYRFLECP